MYLLQLDTHPKGRVGSSPRELCALAVQEFGHCPSQGASLGWLCEGRAEAGMHGESQAGLDMSPPPRDTERTDKAGTVRATGLIRGWISGALHELCAWQGGWGLPTLGGMGRLSSPRS